MLRLPNVDDTKQPNYDNSKAKSVKISSNISSIDPSTSHSNETNIPSKSPSRIRNVTQTSFFKAITAFTSSVNHASSSRFNKGIDNPPLLPKRSAHSISPNRESTRISSTTTSSKRSKKSRKNGNIIGSYDDASDWIWHGDDHNPDSITSNTDLPSDAFSHKQSVPQTESRPLHPPAPSHPPPAPLTPVVLITGCTAGGIGHSLCLAFARRGCIVFGTVRRPDRMNDLKGLVVGEGSTEMMLMDVCDGESIKRVVHAILEKTGRIDILVR